MNEIETKNILTVSTNSYPIIEKIDKNIKTYLKKLFEVKPEINEYLHNAISMLPVDYHLFHYRLGDDVLINNNKVNNDVYLQNFETNKKENAVVISDSLAFKQLFEKCKDVHVFLNTPTHTNQEENIDTLIDFLLITKAKSINCYSVYRWISNFVFWSSIVYDIPLFNIKK